MLINSFYIDSFRGINDLKIDNLNHINVIVGDNNCGKTSVLEALMLLRNPKDLTNLFRVARSREASLFINNSSLYESFINLFSKNNEQLDLSAAYLVDDLKIAIRVLGEEKQIIIEPQDIPKRYSIVNNYHKSDSGFISRSEILAFNGLFEYSIGDQYESIPVEINEYSRVSGMEIKSSPNSIKMQYLTPFDHLKGNIINRIISNDDYKEICLKVIQIFDEDIVDLLILKNEITGRPIEYIKHRKLGNMPISTYGDGIKKVLALANEIARSAGGILLIDEIETAIHSKYYRNIFNFIVKACIQFNVQVFITTHSIEAVDGILSTQNYDSQNKNDDVTVVTIKKTHNKSFSRVLSGREVYNDRNAFGFEVRL